LRDLVFFADFFEDFFALFFLLFLGTLAPSALASERPMAMACFRLFTFLPDRPLFNVPALRFFIARPTLAEAFFEYLRAILVSPLHENQSQPAAKVPSLRWRAATQVELQAVPGLIRSPQSITNPGLGEHELRAFGIDLDFLPELPLSRSLHRSIWRQSDFWHYVRTRTFLFASGYGGQLESKP